MPSKTQSILLGAAVAAILSTSYLSFINCLCCAGVIIAGMVTVWHYTDQHELTISGGQGAVMGLLAAGLGAFIAIFINYVLIQMGIRADQAILEAMLNAFGENMPPEQVEAMEEQLGQPVTFGAHFLSGLLGVVVSALFGAVGGAIGAAVFKKGPAPDEQGAF